MSEQKILGPGQAAAAEALEDALKQAIANRAAYWQEVAGPGGKLERLGPGLWRIMPPAPKAEG